MSKRDSNDRRIAPDQAALRWLSRRNPSVSPAQMGRKKTMNGLAKRKWKK